MLTLNKYIFWKLSFLVKWKLSSIKNYYMTMNKYSSSTTTQNFKSTTTTTTSITTSTNYYYYSTYFFQPLLLLLQLPLTTTKYTCYSTNHFPLLVAVAFHYFPLLEAVAFLYFPLLEAVEFLYFPLLEEGGSWGALNLGLLGKDIPCSGLIRPPRKSLEMASNITTCGCDTNHHHHNHLSSIIIILIIISIIIITIIYHHHRHHTSSLVNDHFKVLQISVACSTFLAPTIGTVPLEIHQLIATWDIVTGKPSDSSRKKEMLHKWV